MHPACIVTKKTVMSTILGNCAYFFFKFKFVRDVLL